MRRTKRLLEDQAGIAVTGYRAASFSIGARNLWAHQVLAEEGYGYSSSVYPVKHDIYGMPEAPRFLISEAALRATGLLQPGSLVRWNYRLKLPENAADDRAMAALIDDSRKAAPEAGWEVRSRSKASPQLEGNIDRFTQFLTRN